MIQAALQGIQSGYDELTAKYKDRLYRSVLLEVDCDDLAQDIVQDAFVRAFLNLGSFRGNSGFYTWLYRIALNVRRSYFRKLPPTVPIDSLGDIWDSNWTESWESPMRNIERFEECLQVREALRRMDEPHRTVLVLREFEGFDYQTIADLLDIKIGTVRSRLSRARAELKEQLSDYLQSLS